MEDARKGMIQCFDEVPNPSSGREANHLDKLRVICTNPVVEAMYCSAVASLPTDGSNPWAHSHIDDFQLYLLLWARNASNLSDILSFSAFYKDNVHGQYFLNRMCTKSQYGTKQTREMRDWMLEFVDMCKDASGSDGDSDEITGLTDLLNAE